MVGEEEPTVWEECMQPEPVELSKDFRKKLKKVLDKYSTVFTGAGQPNTTPTVSHTIELIDAASLQTMKSPPLRRRSKMDEDFIAEKIEELLKLGVIRRAKHTMYACQPVIVRKPGKTPRLCIDYGAINKLTKPDAYPIPRIDDIMISLGGCIIFSVMDAARGYWQVPVDELSKPLTAFKIKQGTFEFNVMPFGLVNAPATFCRWVDKVFQGLPFVKAYMDDFTISSRNKEEHISHLEQALERCRKFGLSLRRSKCKFFQKQVELLGHIVSAKGMRPDPKKTEAVKNAAAPRNKKDVQSFLGMTQFYRAYIPDLATRLEPLYALTRKGVKWTEATWDKKCTDAFQYVKSVLMDEPLLAFPDFDKQFYVRTDASGYAIGGSLIQFDGDTPKVLEYWSRSLSKAERGYSTTKREALAITQAILR